MRRFFLFLGTLAMVIGFPGLPPVAGQAPTAPAQAVASAKGDSTLKTPWGEPDLQGIWVDDYMRRSNDPHSMPGKSFLRTRNGPHWMRNG